MASKKIIVWMAALSALILLLFCPVETTVVPPWKIRVVDDSGKPLANVIVKEGWRDYSTEFRRSEQSLPTDNDGNVSFPRRTVRAGLLPRAIGKTVAALNPHGQSGPKGFVDVTGPFLSQTDTDYSPGKTMPEVIVVRPQR